MKYAKKSLGQNFLIDQNIISKITNISKIKNKNVIEIGPGKGALTDKILSKGPKLLTIVEKDTNLANNLKLRYLKSKNIKIINKDILQINLDNFIKSKSIIFGNLPYNISSQILVKIIKSEKLSSNLSDLILMFQKELGEKILGKFRSKNYGRISIIVNLKLRLIKKFLVSNNCFFPKPKVTSMVIHFRPKKKFEFIINNLENLEKVTSILFSGKRKMINKNIKKILDKSDIEKIPELNLKFRPSEIKPELYYKITELYEKG